MLLVAFLDSNHLSFNSSSLLLFIYLIPRIYLNTLFICQGTYFVLENVYFFKNTFAAAAKSLQSCPTLCDPIDDSPPGSPIPGILQARTLEWVAIAFSNA